MKRPFDAVSAFQSGLTYTPDDPDLKKMYMESTRLIEIQGNVGKPSGNPWDKRFIGMLMEITYLRWVRMRTILELWHVLSLNIRMLSSGTTYIRFTRSHGLQTLQILS